MAPRARTDAGTEQPRIPLSRDRVLRSAVELADRDGLESLTMRRLAQELGVEAMSLYHHVANKEAVLDGVVEVVVEEVLAELEAIAAPVPSQDWRGAMRTTVLTARQVMLRHRWAPRVLETRTSIPVPVITYFNDLLGILVEGGFSYDLAHHAMHALGSRALGFTQELFVPADPDAPDADAEAMFAQMGDRWPYLAGMLREGAHPDDPDGSLGWCDDQAEFEFGLDVILDGLDRLRGR